MLRGEVDPAVLGDACGEDPTWVCEQVLKSTEGNQFLARAADFLVAKPLAIALIVIVAFVVNRLVRRWIRGFAQRMTGSPGDSRLGRLRQRAPSVLLSTGPVNIRSAARAQTIAAVLRSFATALIYGIAMLLILGELGINLGPLIAGAGIAGVAIGFGAQSLVRDFLSGLFMLVEDQYGVGDIVDLGEANGIVESVTLRSTRLRDVQGTVWHVPNGEVRRVGNKSQQWARALIDVSVAYGTDVRAAEAVIKAVADEVWGEEGWRHRILEEPEVWGVERLDADGVIIRLVVKTLPAEQFQVMRELRMRLKEAFDAEGIEIPFPQRTLWVRNEDGTQGALPDTKPAPVKRATKKRAPRRG